MPQDSLEQLRAIDPGVLAGIVRQDQRSPDLEIVEWGVERLSGKGIVNPDSLFRFSGRARAGQETRPWSVVLKILHRPEEEQDPRDIWYWKRELLLAQSGLLARLPGPLVAARIYEATVREDGAWLWMEHVEGAGGPWTPGQYAFAARELGRANGASLARPLGEDYRWLCAGHCRWWLATCRLIEPERVWDDPYVRGAFPAALRARVERLQADAPAFLAALDRAPQLVSHFDTQRRNLFIRPGTGGGDELVAIDWAWAGKGPLGGDLFALVGSSALLFEVAPEAVGALEAEAWDAYLAGLRDAGWGGEPEVVRLVYTAWFALWLGAGAPSLAGFWTSEAMRGLAEQLFGRGPEDAAAGWAALCAYALDRGDEARALMERVGLG